MYNKKDSKKRKRQKRLLKFKKDCKGFVTVFVTLMLIPAILVSGSAVDLARIYTAKSMVENGNLLVANSMLTNYDALLQDMFGLYGVIEDDTLKSMLTDYVNYSLYGDSSTDLSLGTLQPFYGSTSCVVTITSGEGRNLGNIEVMRRQIEEYAKFRAPVALVDEILKFLDVFESLDEDTDLIEEKQEIDSGFEDLYDIYEKIYECIQEVNKFPSIEAAAYKEVNDYIHQIELDLGRLYDTIVEYGETADEKEQEALEEEYLRLSETIMYTTLFGLEKAMSDVEGDYKVTLKHLEELISLCKKADDQKEKLKIAVENFESNLDNGQGNDALNAEFKNLLPFYQNMLTYELEALAQEVEDYNKSVMDDSREILENALFQRNTLVLESTDLSLTSLKQIQNVFALQYPDNLDRLFYLIETPYLYHQYTAPEEFKLFQDFVPQQQNFYKDLQGLIQESGDGGMTKKEGKSQVSGLLKTIQELYNSAVVFEPEGATSLPNTVTSSSFAFEEASGWGSDDDMIGSNVFSLLGEITSGLFDDAVGKGLLLVYDLEMFSDYVSNRSPAGEEEKKEDVSMAGIPFNVKNNYLYQSEVEYLFNGNSDSIANLKAVYGIMYAVRLVFNYTASFGITEVNTAVQSLYAIPYVGWLIGEAARFGFAMGETLVDIAKLRSGGTVPLLKTNDTWQLSVQGLLGEAKDSVEQKVSDASKSSTTSSDSSALELSYSNYLAIFLFFVDGDTLAKRTADLIQANVNWYRDGGDSLSDAFALNQANTDFDVSTTVDIKFLFLSMPLAQNFAQSGITPPTTFPISASISRGY